MPQSFWFCARCYLLHQDGEECPNQNAGAEPDTRGLAPAILGRTSENAVRPDENNFAKEMRISARVIEEAGQMTPALRKHFKEEIAKYGWQSGTRWRNREVPFVVPAEFRRKKYI